MSDTLYELDEWEERMGYTHRNPPPPTKRPETKCPDCKQVYVEDLDDCCVVCGFYTPRGIYAQGVGSGCGIRGVGASTLPIPSTGRPTSK